MTIFKRVLRLRLNRLRLGDALGSLVTGLRGPSLPPGGIFRGIIHAL